MKEKRLVFRGKGPEGGASSKKVESSDPVTDFADRMISGEYEKELRAKGDAMRAEKRAEALRQKQADVASADALMAELKLEPNKDEDFDKILNDLDGSTKDVTASAADATNELLHGETATDYKAIVDGTSSRGKEVIAKNDQ